ncbi:MAG TPA: aldo/keto reductase, partial [Patescibacteria group bacterium]|nr:aldo/keto reductase [Patescibacteria group bacterium]
GVITHDQAIADLFAYVEQGVNTFDVGDIYTGTEEIVGVFLAAFAERNGKAKAGKLRVHTKFVPDLNALEDLTRQDIRAIIERSLKRLGQERLNLVQFHWWDYAKGDFVQAGIYLEELRKEGLIESIGLTNFDCTHVQQLLDAGVSVQSNQIQYSLLDPRPLNGMLELAQKNSMAIFCYGVLAGGLLAGSKPGEESTNRSHIKYRLIIDDVGSEYYEAVLRLLDVMSVKYRTSAANVAVAFALQTPGVSSAILGPRNTNHIDELVELDNLKLTDKDYQQLRALQDRLLETNYGDIYSYERDLNGPHGQIMKYNLNGMRAATIPR